MFAGLHSTWQNTGDKYTYSLKGVSEEPLAEGNVTAECAARQVSPLTFDVFNVSASGEACELRVDSDLLHVSGPQTVCVPPRAKGTLPGSVERVKYTLSASPQMGGMISGSITFTAPDGRCVPGHPSLWPCGARL